MNVQQYPDKGSLDDGLPGRTIVSGKQRASLYRLLLLILLILGVPVMSQADATVEDYQKRKSIADAEKAALEAEIERDEVKKKLADLQSPADPAKAAKEAAVGAANDAKEIADARRALSDAELAALKARIGEVPTSGITGTMTLKEGAASLETALLAARATAMASKKIAEAVSPAAPGNILVFAAGELPDFQATTAFFAQRAIVLQALTEAVAASQQAEKAEAVPIAAVGVALDAVAKVLGYFKSDFELYGTEVTADHQLLAKAVAGELLSTKKVVYLKGAFNPTAVTTVGTTLTTHLNSLAFQREKAATALKKLEREISELETKLGKITGTDAAAMDEKRKMSEQQKRLQDAVDRLRSALAAYDTFASKLATPDANASAMIRELDILNALAEPSATLLVVKMDRAGGSSYVEKNLWTAFGKMPYKVMGGVIASYTLFEGSNGIVRASGLVPVHGGFSRANEVGELFK